MIRTANFLCEFVQANVLATFPSSTRNLLNVKIHCACCDLRNVMGPYLYNIFLDRIKKQSSATILL